MNARPYQCAAALMVLVSMSSHAYQVRAGATALSNLDPNQVTLFQSEDDGPTSLMLDTGIVTGAYPEESASAFASVDLVAGKIKLGGTADTAINAPEIGQGGQVASANASFFDSLSFKLAPGVASATVGFFMKVEGTASPGFEGGGGIGGSSTITLGDISVASELGMGPLGLFRGEVTIDKDTVLLLQARTSSGCRTDIGGVVAGACFFDLLNTASVALEPLPEGVTFTSEGGFNAVVPVPAAAWLFGSALGLLGWVGRRSHSSDFS